MSDAELDGDASHSHHPLSCSAMPKIVSAASFSGSEQLSYNPNFVISSFPQCDAIFPAATVWLGCVTNLMVSP